MVIAAVSIIVLGKNFDISWSAELAGTLNTMAFCFSFLRSGVLYTKATFRGLVVCQIMAKGKAANKI